MPPSWPFAGVAAAGAAQASPKENQPGSSADASESVEQQKDPVFQAGKLGFVIGAMVSPKKGEEIWQIIGTHVVDGEKSFELQQVVNGELTNDKLQVAADAIVVHWRVRKFKLTAPLSGWDPASNVLGSPLCSASWASDCVKGAIALALRLALEQHSGLLKDLEVLQNPFGVRVKRTFAPGFLFCFFLGGASFRCVEARAGDNARGAHRGQRGEV